MSCSIHPTPAYDYGCPKCVQSLRVEIQRNSELHRQTMQSLLDAGTKLDQLKADLVKAEFERDAWAAQWQDANNEANKLASERDAALKKVNPLYQPLGRDAKQPADWPKDIDLSGRPARGMKLNKIIEAFDWLSTLRENGLGFGILAPIETGESYTVYTYKNTGLPRDHDGKSLLEAIGLAMVNIGDESPVLVSLKQS